jgi:aminoglycoside adenylyltransferase-like protein
VNAVFIISGFRFLLYPERMQATSYPQVNALLDKVLAGMQATLGDKLVGLYLFGSLVTGDYDDGISDMDLLAALTNDLDMADFNRLNAMHSTIVGSHPQWENRIEIAYLSLYALKTFKTRASKIGIISPGEPFHIIETDKGWLMNWYMVQEKGVTLFGPPPQRIIEPISKAEFLQTVKESAAARRQTIQHVDTHPSQAYAILTMCRALYTLTHGEHVSKRKAASWAAQELPEWAAVIQRALRWRESWRTSDANYAETLPETRRFVLFMIERITGS